MTSDLAGRVCAIVGSAPGVRLPDRADRYVATNAAGPYCAAQGHPPDYWLVTGYMLRENDPHRQHAYASMAGLSVGVLGYIERGMDWQAAARLLQVKNVTWGTFDLHTEFVRMQIVEDILGRSVARGTAKERVSNGLYAVCLALQAQASEVVLCGYSLRPGYEGEAWAPLFRGHAAPDRLAFSRLARDWRSRVLTTSRELADEYGMRYTR